MPLATILVLAACLQPAHLDSDKEEAELRAAYTRADEFSTRARNAAFKLKLEAHWLDGHRFWYRNDLKDGVTEYWLVDAATKTKDHPFDAKKLADALTKLGLAPKPDHLILEITNAQPGSLQFRIGRQNYTCDLSSYTVTTTAPAPAERRTASPEKFRVNAGQIEAKNGDTWTPITKLGSYETFAQSDLPNKILALRVLPGDHKKLYLLHSTGSKDKTRATLEERLYDQPGDQMDRFEPILIDADAKTETKLPLDPLLGGAYPWPGPPFVRQWHGQWLITSLLRGNQEFKILRIDPASGAVTTPVDEKVETFIDVAHTAVEPLQSKDEILYQSERSGWSQLYRIDAKTGAVINPVTPGNGVFRETLTVDEKSREVFFMGNAYPSGNPKGAIPQEDPYQLHAYRSNLDTGETISLTPGDGTHTVQLSPDHSFLVDSYSRVDLPPIHELRSAKDGSLVMTLEKADVDQLKKNGVPMPERFVAKGRDGQTDIWGVVFKPTNFDRHKRYPIVENIYAGPHDSFVPKAYQPIFRMQAQAELGFIVVQIDGMGTSNRGKKFHDVCWKNLADGGFPDRILWMKALAKKIPQLDLTKVGVYGTSAGGQDAANAVLFHPEFYTAAVASCGCYDNRIDKQWWNEQWMGYPVGPHYADQAAANHVAALKGHLMLFVGEDDHNVPPESTYQLVDALMRAKKEFEMLVFPAFDHTDGGPYGERKRRDFFVRWLLGKTPPNWNE